MMSCSKEDIPPQTWIRGLLSVEIVEGVQVYKVFVQGLQKYIPLRALLVSRLGDKNMEVLLGRYAFWVAESVEGSFDSSEVVNILDFRIKKLY